MNSDFLLKQCKVLEDTFLGGDEDTELRKFVESVQSAKTQNVHSDDSAESDQDYESSETSSDSESSDTDMDVLGNSIQLEGGAVAALPVQRTYWDDGGQIDESGFGDTYAVPEKPQLEDGMQMDFEMAKLRTTLDDIREKDFDREVEEEEIAQQRSWDLYVQDRQQAEENYTLELMDDPIWIRGGIQTANAIHAKMDELSNMQVVEVISSRPLTETGKLIPPGPGYIQCLGWMERFLTFISSANFDTFDKEALTQLYMDAAMLIRENWTLALMNTRLEWLDFQEYVLGRV